MDQPPRSDPDAATVATDPDAEPTSAEALLQSLLERYDADPAARAAIEAEVERRFRRPHAVLVLDSSGFTRTVKTKGIIHFLALLQRLERLVRPIITESGGHIVAREGDTIFAVFDRPASAVEAATAIQRRVADDNADRHDDEQVTCAIGIGYGDILMIGEHHIAGDEVNVAFKLGEDLAEGGEILVSAAAEAQLDGGQLEIESVQFEISGVAIHAHRVRVPTR
jgi:class 3 adenylate cyclase